MNCSKTNSILFTSNRSKYKGWSLNLSLNNAKIEPANEIKYLGLILDRNLTFERHISKLCCKVTARTKLLWRKRHFIPTSLAITLYKSLIQPHFIYCDFILDGVTEGLKDKMQVHQNNALRAVLNVDYDYATNMYTEVKVDNIRTNMKKSCCKIVYKGFYNLGPKSLNDMYELYTPGRELRSSKELQVKIPKVNTQFGAKNIRIRGSNYWKTLPIDIKSAKNINTLKDQLKKYRGFDQPC